MNRRLEIKIKDKHTKKTLISVFVADNKLPNKYANVCFAMLTLLYAMERKGKAQYWEIPSKVGYMLQLAYNWGDGSAYKKHTTLYKIPVVWGEDL